MGPLERMASLLADLPSDDREAIIASLPKSREASTKPPKTVVRTPLLPRQGGSGIRLIVRRVGNS